MTITNSGTASSAWLMREPIMGSSYDTFGTIADGTSEARTEVAGYEPLVSADVLLDPPVVTGVSPASGPTAGGQQVTISGDHFTGASSVTFGGQPASGVSVLSDEVLTTTTPASAAGTVDVIVAAQSGQSTASDAARYTYASVAPDATPPLIGSLGMSPARFLSANTGPALIAAVVGTRVTYTLSEPATTTFKVQKARRVKRHTRYVTMKGRLTHAGAQGQNRFRFMGRLRNRQLRPGKYRLVAVGKDAAGNRSKPVRRKFRIVPAPR